MKYFFRIGLFLVICLIIISIFYKKNENKNSKKLQITTTSFPVYDFCKNIVKDKAHVKLLLSPGVEAHSFELEIQDMVFIQNSDILIYTNKSMEPWISDFEKSLQNNFLLIDSSKDIVLNGDGDEHNKDPHIWLDPILAKKMIDNILAGIIEKDPKNVDFYEINARNYKFKLDKLNQDFINTFSKLKTKKIVYIGHFAFSYFVNRYNLEYISPYKSFSPNANENPKEIAEIIENIKKLNIKYIFYNKMENTKKAEIISKETNTKILPLNSIGNISKKEFENNISYLDLMYENAKNLKEGLSNE